MNSDFRHNTSTYDLFGCGEEKLERHIQEVFEEADLPHGLTMDEIYE